MARPAFTFTLHLGARRLGVRSHQMECVCPARTVCTVTENSGTPGSIRIWGNDPGLLLADTGARQCRNFDDAAFAVICAHRSLLLLSQQEGPGVTGIAQPPCRAMTAVDQDPERLGSATW